MPIKGLTALELRNLPLCFGEPADDREQVASQGSATGLDDAAV